MPGSIEITQNIHSSIHTPLLGSTHTVICPSWKYILNAFVFCCIITLSLLYITKAFVEINHPLILFIFLYVKFVICRIPWSKVHIKCFSYGSFTLYISFAFQVLCVGKNNYLYTEKLSYHVFYILTGTLHCWCKS